MIGADYYDAPVVEAQQTLSEILAGMTNTQKLAVLDSFCKRPPTYGRMIRELRHVHGVKFGTASFLWGKLEEIEGGCRRVMTGQWELTPAVLDAEGNVTTEATYKSVPTTVGALKTFISSHFTGSADDFTTAQIGAIIDKLILASKYDGTGTWTFYKANVK